MPRAALFRALFAFALLWTRTPRLLRRASARRFGLALLRLLTLALLRLLALPLRLFALRPGGLSAALLRLLPLTLHLVALTLRLVALPTLLFRTLPLLRSLGFGASASLVLAVLFGLLGARFFPLLSLLSTLLISPVSLLPRLPCLTLALLLRTILCALSSSSLLCLLA